MVAFFIIIREAGSFVMQSLANVKYLLSIPTILIYTESVTSVWLGLTCFRLGLHSSSSRDDLPVVTAENQPTRICLSSDHISGASGSSRRINRTNSPGIVRPALEKVLIGQAKAYVEDCVTHRELSLKYPDSEYLGHLQCQVRPFSW